MNPRITNLAVICRAGVVAMSDDYPMTKSERQAFLTAVLALCEAAETAQVDPDAGDVYEAQIAYAINALEARKKSGERVG